MSQTALFEYGCKIIDLYKPFRFITFIDTTDIDDIKRLIHEQLGITLYSHQVETVKRETSVNFHMKWHMDDRVIVKRKQNSNSNDLEIIMDSKYKLIPRENKIPEFSAILYLSDGGIDFKGGELQFVDQTIIPQKHKFVFFNSNEVHRVLQVQSGIRKMTLFKFYKI